MPLMALIATITTMMGDPGAEPRWLAPYIDALARGVGAGLRIVFAAPPQHGKSQAAKVALAWHLCFGRKSHAYVTYGAELAEEVAHDVRTIAELMGVELTGRTSLLRGPWGATCIFTGIGGKLTGKRITGLLVIDDPLKNYEEAFSRTIRERANNWLLTVARTRMHRGASAFLMATRWHTDDPSARRIKAGWTYIRIPAVAENDSDPLGRQPGEALCPHLHDGEELAGIRREIGESNWYALYQGSPRPKDGQLFGDPHWYDTVPPAGYRVGYGIDLAYSEQTQRDYSVLIRGLVTQDVGPDGKTRRKLYVTHVWRMQSQAHVFAGVVKAALAERAGPILWYCAGPEKGVAQLIRSQGVPLNTRTATTDKRQRAGRTVVAWERGDILLPSDRTGLDVSWVPALIDELQDFGGGDAHDDQVDALAALHDLMLGTTGGGAGSGGAVADDDSGRAAA